jgi:hypothetical protein
VFMDPGFDPAGRPGMTIRFVQSTR